MAKWVIYHNPRCTKSRQALELLKEKGIEPEVRLYLKDLLNLSELKEIYSNLKIHPSDGLRMKEADFKNAKIDISNESQVLELMKKFPKTIERPIVFKGKKGVIARPTEKILDLI